MRLISWPDGKRYLRPLQSLVVSLLLSLVSSFFFSDWWRTISSKFFDTQVLSISTEERVLPRHARSVLSCLRCLLLSSYHLGLAESRILPAALADHRPRTLLISICTVQLRTLFPARSLATLCLLTTSWSGSWGVARLLELHGLPPYPHPSEGVG